VQIEEAAREGVVLEVEHDANVAQTVQINVLRAVTAQTHEAQAREQRGQPSRGGRIGRELDERPASELGRWRWREQRHAIRRLIGRVGQPHLLFEPQQ
jgi:hypothetical protein